MRPVGVPNLLAAQRLAAATGALRRESAAAQGELTTGRIADLAAALGSGLGEAFALRGAIDAIAVRREGLARAGLVAGAAQRALEAVGAGARGLATEAVAANGRRDDVALARAAAEAETELRAAVSHLNIRVAGQAIFAGDASDRPALLGADQLIADVAAIYAAAPDAAALDSALAFYFDDPAGGFQSTVYAGGSGPAPTIEVAAGERLAFTIRADDDAIRGLLKGLATIAVAGAAPSSPLREGALAGAASAAIAGADALSLRRAGIGAAQARAAEAEAMLFAEGAALTEAYNGLTARDPYEAAARLQSLEAQLGAALALTARLSRLSLADFLR